MRKATSRALHPISSRLFSNHTPSKFLCRFYSNLPSQMEQQLLERWQSLLKSTAPSAEQSVAQKWFSTIVDHYSERQRHYHTLTHIRELFELYDIYHFDTPTVNYAIWFHDVIYQPTQHDNEEESAKLFGEFAKQDTELTNTVKHFILCTKSHTEAPEGNRDLDYFLDFDLYVLAKVPHEYDIYAQQIRQEYIHYSDTDYTRGRAKVLEKFIAIPSLYRTQEFKHKFEPVAKSNLQRELGKLSEKLHVL